MPAAAMSLEAPESYAPPAGANSTIQAYQPPAPDNSPMPGAPEVHGAIDSALNSSSSQIEFDALTQRFRGKKVWVIDRDKIKRNVASVVDQAISKSLENAEDAADTRKSVAEAIEKLFKDNRNITSPQGSGSGSGGKNLDAQIDRTAAAVAKLSRVERVDEGYQVMARISQPGALAVRGAGISEEATRLGW